MATILKGLPAPGGQNQLRGGPVLTPREAAQLRLAPKKGGTQVTVRSYPVKLAGVPLFGREHMYTEYDDGDEQYIFRGGPSWHGLHAQVDPAAESPDHGRGRRVIHETYIPGQRAAEAAEPARRTADRIENSGARYRVVRSNSNTAVADQMEDQFGYRVGLGEVTPGWRRDPTVTPPKLR